MILTNEQIEKWNNNRLFIRFEDNPTVEEINYVLKHEFYNVNPKMILTTGTHMYPIEKNSNVFLICREGHGTIFAGYRIGNEHGFDYVLCKKPQVSSILKKIIEKLENYEKFKA
jgi:hypothetical protein